VLTSCRRVKDFSDTGNNGINSIWGGKLVYELRGDHVFTYMKKNLMEVEHPGIILKEEFMEP
jgi:hypothetical protein